MRRIAVRRISTRKKKCWQNSDVNIRILIVCGKLPVWQQQAGRVRTAAPAGCEEDEKLPVVFGGTDDTGAYGKPDRRHGDVVCGAVSIIDVCGEWDTSDSDGLSGTFDDIGI